MNAKQELIEHIEGKPVKYVSIEHEFEYGKRLTIEGALDKVLTDLDFEYNDDFGSQKLFGTIWYEDGTWSDRDEYDGSEWWVHRQCPPLPNA